MRICVPTMGLSGARDLVSEHFGRAASYTFVDSESGAVQVVPNDTLHMGGVGYPPDLIRAHGGEVMVCGGLGRRAVAMFEERGVMVYIGARGTVRDAVAQWRAGQLEAATDENACRQHAFREEEGHEHGHGHQHGHHPEHDS